MKYFSMFSGIGGFELGIQQAYENICNKKIRGQRQTENLSVKDSGNSVGKPNVGQSPYCIGYSEIDKYAIQVYQKHFNHKAYGDCTKINVRELPDFDMLVGGFPCQSFSIAGKRGGFEDTRGTMFFEIARIARAKRPKILFLENVKGLLSSRSNLTFEQILDIMFTDLINRETLCQNQIQKVLESEMLMENLSSYLLSIGEISGLLKSLKSLPIKILPIIKKLKDCQTEQIVLSEEIVEEWALSLKQLSLIESLNQVDMLWLEKMAVINADVGWKLKKCLEENLQKKKLSTILTELKQMIDGKIYLYVQELCIILFMLKQYKSLTPLWLKIKSNLINIKPNTYYVNSFNIILNTLDELGYDCQWQVLNSKNFGVPQNRERVFIIGHSRGSSRPKVFPIGESSKQNLKEYTRECSQGNRVYDPSGISTTIASQAGGLGAKTGLYAIGGTQKNAAKMKDQSPALTEAMGKGGGHVPIINPSTKIRRLTPTECMRLQGFPDSWCDVGADGKKISDSQKYKMAGNAVTVNVIKYLIKQICKPT